jgi:hypothetical protein
MHIRTIYSATEHIEFNSMSQLGTMPGLPIDTPIQVTTGDSFRGQVLIPKELAPFSAAGFPQSQWWVLPSSHKHVKVDKGVPPAILKVAIFSSSGFAITFEYETYLKQFTSILFMFDQYNIKPSNPADIDPASLADAIISDEYHTWLYIRDRFTLNNVLTTAVLNNIKYWESQ